MGSKENRFERSISKKEIRNSFLIVCEGGKTEPNYFKGFRVPRTIIEGTGMNTVSLIQYTIAQREKYRSAQIHFNEVWCVLDRDSFPAPAVALAHKMAEQHGINLAYSNESFELWYYLHFHLLETGLGRKDYISKLNHLLGYKYSKSSEDMYRSLLLRQRAAIRHAKQLELRNKPINPLKCPYTTVHKLVEVLNESLLK
ncbi:MAG: RloB family protein [Bacteroidia bacterium]|nr:RloB family protein [Bacteroidia bacterium]